MPPDTLLHEAQALTKLENLLAWAIRNNFPIHTMLQQDEFSSDIVLATDGQWLVFDVS